MASTENGAVAIFVRAESKITPASPQPNAANGGAPATSHGWYGFTSADRNIDFGFGQFGALNLLPLGQKHWLMEAYESGGGCTGNVQRTWLSVGSAPDLTGAQYSGSRCSPPGTFSMFAILATW